MEVRSKALRNAARGAKCTLQIVGVCSSNPETTVLAHLPNGGRGVGLKGCDLNAVHACGSCHDAIDRRAISQEFEDHKEWYMRRALHLTVVALVNDGVLVIRGEKRPNENVVF